MKRVIQSIKQFFASFFSKKAEQPKAKIVVLQGQKSHLSSYSANGVKPKTSDSEEENHLNSVEETIEEVRKNPTPVDELESFKASTNEPIKTNVPIKLNFKQAWMLNYVTSQTKDGNFIGPSKVGREWGLQIKLKKGYNSGHSRKVLLDLVSMGMLVKNSEGQYRCK